MLLSAILLAAVVTNPQDPAARPSPDASAVKSADLPAGSSGIYQSALEAGLAAFKRRRFTEAEGDFRRAMEADPKSAGAAFYLGYTYYKLAEHKRPFHPDKQKAKDLFARAFELDPAFRPVWGSSSSHSSSAAAKK
jgi:tetratricopeptide (TPR) repeat protein